MVAPIKCSNDHTLTLVDNIHYVELVLMLSADHFIVTCEQHLKLVTPLIITLSYCSTIQKGGGNLFLPYF